MKWCYTNKTLPKDNTKVLVTPDPHIFGGVYILKGIAKKDRRGDLVVTNLSNKLFKGSWNFTDYVVSWTYSKEEIK